MYHYFYKITNLLNEKYYVGIHSTENLNDNYFGSGAELRKELKELGKENFKKENLKFFDSREELSEYERNYIKENNCQSDPNCYNIAPGGDIKNFLHLISLKNVITGKSAMYDTKDPQVIELRKQKILVHRSSGYKSYINLSTNEIEYLEINNEETKQRLKNKEIINLNKGKTTFLNIQTGLKEFVSVNDSRIKEGILVGHTKGFTVYKNINTGETKYLSVNDPILKTNEWICCNLGKAPYRNLKTGKIEQYIVDSEETRKLIADGVIEAKNKGQFTYWNTKTNQYEFAYKTDPRRKTGELIGICKGTLRLFDTRTGKVRNVSIKEYEKDKEFLIHEKRNKQSYKDEYGNILYLTKEEAKERGLKGLRYQTIKLVKETGERCVCYKEELESKIKEGWKLGYSLYKITKGSEEKTIAKEDIFKYYKEGWQFSINLISLYKDNKKRIVEFSKLEKCINAGYSLVKSY